MEIFQIVGLGIVATIIATVLKMHRPEVAIQISLLTGVIILMVILSKVAIVLDLMNSYFQKLSIDPLYFGTLLKIIGIAYIAEFGAEICKDAERVQLPLRLSLRVR